jgi:hypothetical protein
VADPHRNIPSSPAEKLANLGNPQYRSGHLRESPGHRDFSRIAHGRIVHPVTVARPMIGEAPGVGQLRLACILSRGDRGMPGRFQAGIQGTIMKVDSIWLLGLLCMVQAGCGIYENAARNLAVQPFAVAHDRVEEARTRKWARAAWREVEHCGDKPFSSDYRRGFVRGFTDYVQYGGKGEPPVVPPVCYRMLHEENPAGHEAAEEWFAGFRHGVAVAQSSGRRQWITLPISTGYNLDPYGGVMPASSEKSPELLPKPTEDLPTPKILPDDPPDKPDKLDPKEPDELSLQMEGEPASLIWSRSSPGTVPASSGWFSWLRPYLMFGQRTSHVGSEDQP